MDAPQSVTATVEADAERFRWLMGWHDGKAGASFEQLMLLIADVPKSHWRETIDGWRGSRPTMLL